MTETDGTETDIESDGIGKQNIDDEIYESGIDYDEGSET